MTEGVARIVLRPLAGPLALGFLGLAAATFVVAGLNLGWVERARSRRSSRTFTTSPACAGSSRP
jgi:hypothetical protein